MYTNFSINSVYNGARRCSTLRNRGTVTYTSFSMVEKLVYVTEPLLRSVLQGLAPLYTLFEHPFLGMPRWCNG